MSVVSFAAGFVSGWLVRSTVESSRGLALKAVGGYHGLLRRAESVLVAEREFFEDFWAEVKASGQAVQEDRPRPSERIPMSTTPSHDGAVPS